MSGAYYNEYDKYAAAWLRNLIRAGLIPAGDVDERSIEDVAPDDLRGYTQCHFFAGIGVWPYALRRAGWDDTRPVWTGSCPCQPFSQAGEGLGFADERHLWPAFHHLIRECRPADILGEQVASKDVDIWIDLVHADLEGMGYAFGTVPFPSAGSGAPHIRDRNYWVGIRGLADTDDARLEGRLAVRERPAERAAGARGVAGGMADATGPGWRPERQDCHSAHVIETVPAREAEPGRCGAIDIPGPTNGYWRTADWLGCTDGKWRPVEPGTFPLAHGLARGMGTLGPGLRRLADMAGIDGASLDRARKYRIGSLRGYGNAVNAEAALAWVRCVMESRERLDVITAQPARTARTKATAIPTGQAA